MARRQRLPSARSPSPASGAAGPTGPARHRLPSRRRPSPCRVAPSRRHRSGGRRRRWLVRVRVRVGVRVRLLLTTYGSLELEQLCGEAVAGRQWLTAPSACGKAAAVLCGSGSCAVRARQQLCGLEQLCCEAVAGALRVASRPGRSRPGRRAGLGPQSHQAHSYPSSGYTRGRLHQGTPRVHPWVLPGFTRGRLH